MHPGPRLGSSRGSTLAHPCCEGKGRGGAAGERRSHLGNSGGRREGAKGVDERRALRGATKRNCLWTQPWAEEPAAARAAPRGSPLSAQQEDQGPGTAVEIGTCPGVTHPHQDQGAKEEPSGRRVSRG